MMIEIIITIIIIGLFVGIGVMDICAGIGHPYFGDDEFGGRCFCGNKRYK